jgi:hypothetical protein
MTTRERSMSGRRAAVESLDNNAAILAMKPANSSGRSLIESITIIGRSYPKSP